MVSSAAPARQFRSVLIAEDDDDVRASMSMILESAGFATIAASNGAEALALLKRMLPDAVLLDMNMPVVTGADFLREKAGDPLISGVPVIAISGANIRGTPAGALTVLRKPFDLDDFISALRVVPMP